MFNPWPALQSVPGLIGVPAIWRAALGDAFTAFSTFLRACPRVATSLPCPRQCGCAHEIIRHPDGAVVAVCRCEPWNCEDLHPAPGELTLLELNSPKLARALCHALALQPTSAPSISTQPSVQVGSYSAGHVPVILTFESDPGAFGGQVAELTARLRQPFILLAPSSSPLDAAAQELLANVGAGFFSLDACVRLTPQGALEPAKSPQELFARLRPEPQEAADEDIARKAFALVEQLDSEDPVKGPSALTVFRLYCLEELSATQIARRCGSSKTSIMRRLELIRAKTGVAPARLRRLCPYFEKLEADLADSRARHIHRKGLID